MEQRDNMLLRGSMEQLEGNPSDLHVTCFSNEARLHLHGYINKQTFSLINTFWSIVNDAILLLNSELPTATNKFPKCAEQSWQFHNKN
jgi:hypothetical protein